MKSSEVLRRAARSVERGSQSLGCLAIYNVVRWSERRSDAAMGFFLRVGPARDSGDPWWGGWPAYDESEHRDARIVGLCFAAAIAESEGQ